jgi:hypothetical protein
MESFQSDQDDNALKEYNRQEELEVGIQVVCLVSSHIQRGIDFR